jgi:hypothetical protein
MSLLLKPQPTVTSPEMLQGRGPHCLISNPAKPKIMPGPTVAQLEFARAGGMGAGIANADYQSLRNATRK